MGKQAIRATDDFDYMRIYYNVPAMVGVRVIYTGDKEPKHGVVEPILKFCSMVSVLLYHTILLGS